MQMAPHERLRELRETKGFRSQKHFCAHAQKYGYSIDLRRYGGIERGDIKPNIDDIIAICKAMEISADHWLLGRIESVNLEMLSDLEIKFVKDVIAGLQMIR